MRISKRNLLAGAPLLAAMGLVTAGRTEAAADVKACEAPVVPDYKLPLAKGPFQPSMASLAGYEAPDWFRDAKFGIWAHWGPQAVPRQGDWYARFMYVPGHPHYDQHLKAYGHPSEFGFKDIIPLWTAEKFDPETLMDKYVAAGAKYFVSMGVHHDNFDLWDSKLHRWNAVAMGPKRDVVGEWSKAARKRGLRFGVSEHLGASHNWYYTSHQFDRFWPKMGVNYDGADPKNADLYHHNKGEEYRGDADSWYTTDPAYHQLWFDRISDLVNSYKPDLLYTDGGLPFGKVGHSLVANLYNNSVDKAGEVQAVYACKDLGSGEFDAKTCVQDVERGVLKGINERPWQTDTSNGDWFYSDNYTYKTGREVIYMLSDIVSKNGNLLLNVVLYADGSLPPESQTLLDDMTAWMKVNSAAIHGTRPWKIFGEGPTETVHGAFRETNAYTPQDIRFTSKGNIVYAITLGEPSQSVSVKALAQGGQEARAIKSVKLLGVKKALSFRQTAEALVIDLPALLPTRHASAFEITFRA